LRPRKAIALPLFHAITGCDTTLSFQGSGKKSARDASNAYEEVTGAFLSVLNDKFIAIGTDSAAFSVIERFVVALYDKTVLQLRLTSQEESSSPKKGDHCKVFRQRRCVEFNVEC